MKRLLFFLALILSVITGLGAENDYTPLVVEGAKWHGYHFDNSNRYNWVYIPYTMEIKGDTIIDGIAYKCCFYTFGKTEDATSAIETCILAFLREDVKQKKVYARLSEEVKTFRNSYNIYYRGIPTFGNVKNGDDKYVKKEINLMEDFLLYDFENIYNLDQMWWNVMKNGSPDYCPPVDLDAVTNKKFIINGRELNCYLLGTDGESGIIIEGIGFDKYVSGQGDSPSGMTPGDLILPYINSDYNNQ